MNGTLYIVATPIGNLSDMTFRAVQTLKDVDVIAAEDTRRTIKLLNHFEISTKMMPYHQHNRREAGRKIINMLHNGKNIALVSDAGMPCISDPGFELVSEARENALKVECIPGACAAITAMALSGFDSSQFVFEGFLPRENKDLNKRLNILDAEKRPIIIYESPHRLTKTLKKLIEFFSNRRVCIANELTKIHEKIFICDVSDALSIFDKISPRGEYVIIIDKQDKNLIDDWTNLDIAEHVNQYLESGMSKMDAIKAVAKDRNVPKSQIYSHIVKD